MESEKLLIILKEHCLFKEYKEILFPLLENNEINLFFEKQLKVYDKKALEDTTTYKKFYKSNKDYTALDFPTKNHEKSQSFIFNKHINIKVSFSFYNEALDLDNFNHVKYYTHGEFIFSIENKDKKEIEKLKLKFSQYIVRKYQSTMLIPEFINSKREMNDSIIDIFCIDDSVTSIRLKNFMLNKDKNLSNQRGYNILNPNFNILSDQDFNDAIIYGGLTNEKVELMMLMNDKNSSDFKDYIKNYDKTFFDFISDKPTIKYDNKM